MPRCCDRIKAMAFEGTYSTPKIAIIRDWRLGMLHMALKAAVGIYILVYSLLLDKQWAVVGVLDPQVDLRVHQPTVGASSCDFMVAQFRNDTSCRLDVRNVSGYEYCLESPDTIAYPGTKKSCYTMFGGNDRLFRRVGEGNFFLATHMRFITQSLRLHFPRTSETGGWEQRFIWTYEGKPGQGPDVLRTIGGYNANLEDYVLLPEIGYTVANFDTGNDLQKGSARDSIGFLVTKNAEFCAGLKEAPMTDMFRPGHRYPDGAPNQRFILEQRDARCLVNFDRTRKCFEAREKAKAAGEDMNTAALFNWACQTNMVSISRLFASMDPAGVTSLDEINENWDHAHQVFDPNSGAPQTYRESGIVVHLDVKFTNENQFGMVGRPYLLLEARTERGSSYDTMRFTYQGKNPQVYREVFWEAGIRFQVSVGSDRLLQFAWSQLLAALTAALVLLGMSSFIVEKLMMSRLMKHRHKYEELKYDVGDVIRYRSETAAPPEDQQRAAKVEMGASRAGVAVALGQTGAEGASRRRSEDATREAHSLSRPKFKTMM